MVLETFVMGGVFLNPVQELLNEECFIRTLQYNLVWNVCSNKSILHQANNRIVPSKSDPHLGISSEYWLSVQSVVEIELQTDHLKGSR